MELTLESIEGEPFQLFLDSIRSEKTKKLYLSFLDKFLEVLPSEIFETHLNESPSTNQKEKTNQFIRIAKNDIKITKQIIHAYVRELKVMAENKEFYPSQIGNRLKPIKSLFEVNEIDFSWKLINKSIPRIGKSQDRAYTREELQTLMNKSGDITNKVIILLFSSAGFRVEAWDYFTWSDVKFFYTEEKEPKGLAIRVYKGDAEEYWTHGTPEAQKMLSLYRENWKVRFGKYPEPDDPLLVSTRANTIKRLKYGGVRSRVIDLLRSCGMRPLLDKNTMRHEVPADHGFRKYFNTMCRRAKVDYLDKKDMMGHSNGLEKSYERYNEEDFERFPEYQKAIPFLTISEEERVKAELELKSAENEELTQKNEQLEDNQKKIDKMEKDIAKHESYWFDQNFPKESDSEEHQLIMRLEQIRLKKKDLTPNT